MLRIVAGRPGWRRLLVSYFLAASLRCQASRVAGVTGKTSAQRRRGMNPVSAANQARSAGSYRTRSACRRRTAFSCRSTSSSAFFACSPAERQDSQVKGPAHEQVCDLEQHQVSQPSSCQTGRRNQQVRPRDRVFGRHKTQVCRTLPADTPGSSPSQKVLVDDRINQAIAGSCEPWLDPGA